jgi:hypothetical protein
MRFAEAIGPSITNPGDGSLRKPDRQVERPGRLLRLLGRRLAALPASVKGAIGVTLLGAVLFLVAPAALIALTLLIGLVGLLVGGYALMDPFTAVQLPEPLSPALLLRAGSAALALAFVLAVVI